MSKFLFPVGVLLFGILLILFIQRRKIIDYFTKPKEKSIENLDDVLGSYRPRRRFNFGWLFALIPIFIGLNMFPMVAEITEELGNLTASGNTEAAAETFFETLITIVPVFIILAVAGVIIAIAFMVLNTMRNTGTI